jgi:hypothetical protein
MTSAATYKLSGGGVEVTYLAATTVVEIVLDDSFGPFQVDDAQTTESEQNGDSFVVKAQLTREVASRAGTRTERLDVRVYLPAADPPSDTATEVNATGAIVLIAPGSPRTFRAETLTGTLSVPAGSPVAAAGDGAAVS